MPHHCVLTSTNMPLLPVTINRHYSNTANTLQISPPNPITAFLFPTHPRLHLTAFHHHNPPTQTVVLVEEDFGGVHLPLYQPLPQEAGTSGHLLLAAVDYKNYH